MIQHPGILALLTASLTISLLLLAASWHGLRILRFWDLGSGSERQLALEQRTYLITTILGYALLFQILSLFLFIYTADDLHTVFTGAMCAAGTLQANQYGYPTLLLKLLNCLLAGGWLILNHADNQGYDYPLIRPKYLLVVLMTALVLTETVLLFSYVLNLQGNLITSCCGSLFSSEQPGITGELAGLSHWTMAIWFGVSSLVALASGGWFVLTGRGGWLFSLASSLFMVSALAAIISFISLYYYELPTHHCPFCILQREYQAVGYPLYAALLGGGISGIGVGLVMPARRIVSLASAVPVLQRRLAQVSLACMLLFLVMVAVQMLSTDFRLAW